MIQVARITYACRWNAEGHVSHGPVRVTFGALEPEVTVEQMLEGRGYTMMNASQLLALLVDMTQPPDVLELAGAVPAEVPPVLAEFGYEVKLIA
jgi:hypothetical protein